MNTVSQDLSPSGVIVAWRANLVAYWSQMFRHLPATSFHDEQGIFWFESGIRHDVFNRGMQTRLESASPRGAIRTILGHLQQRRLPLLWHVVAPSFVSEGRSQFERDGLTHYETEPVMAIDLLGINATIPAASSLVIQPVTTHELLQQWIRIDRFASPEEVLQLWLLCYSGLGFIRESPLQLYLGTVEGNPVATSGVFLGGGVALIESVNTVLHYRQQGLGTAMTLMALQHARKQGYRIGVLAASPMGVTMYHRLGFREYGTLSTYLWHPAR